MADIADVAREAGVSTATVSRALRGLSNVSESTRLRVVAVAERLDYRVSRTASGLATGHTGTVGVVVPHISRWFFGQVITGAERVLRGAGLDLLVYSVDDDASRSRFFTQLPARGRVDAMLVLSLPLAETESAALRGLGVPLAIVGAQSDGFGCVRIDDRHAARVAVRHLVNIGHHRIGLIGGNEDSTLGFTAPGDRLAGYLDVLADAGLERRAEWEAPGLFTARGGEQAMTQLLAASQPPTAVFAMSDEMAIGALKALRRHHLSAPRDISIVGFDDHEMAEALDLTTIAQPVASQGEAVARMLLDQLKTGKPPEPRILPTHLVVRASTAAPDSRGRT
ncbi:LacI family DNA-binding transcriptional regulator [Lentzea sp. HUAS12]|uniref:LacI family DNA-binding transcriptional regulator n=1 Tax=Lentzea sp. HUAS12 TaxID=2951806 RepID=UPI0020A1DE2F|nr:LacI family DNA-binding transcriptional regulator [Lentzea sp. HUAS12]USX56262.1 LacI family transcriptional regulator [Lentzea sp. HUAS12]